MPPTTPCDIAQKVAAAIQEAADKYGPNPDDTDDEWLRILTEEIQETAALIDNDGTSPETENQLESELVQVIATAVRWLQHRRSNVPETPETPPHWWQPQRLLPLLQEANDAAATLAAAIPASPATPARLARNPHTQAPHCVQQAQRLLQAAQTIARERQPLNQEAWRKLNRH